MSIIKLDPSSRTVEDIFKATVLADYKHVLIIGETQEGHLEVSLSDMGSKTLAWFILQLTKWYYSRRV